MEFHDVPPQQRPGNINAAPKLEEAITAKARHDDLKARIDAIRGMLKQTPDFIGDENGGMKANYDRQRELRQEIDELTFNSTTNLRMPNIQISEARLSSIRQAGQAKARAGAVHTEQYTAKARVATPKDNDEEVVQPVAVPQTEATTGVAKNKKLGTRIKETYVKAKGKIIEILKILAVAVIGETVNQGTDELR